MLVDRVHVSSSNNKIGKTANVSLLPVITCEQGASCAKDCYARGLLYSPTALKAWTDNTALAVNDPSEFHRQVSAWIEKHEPSFFRWHVSGDIPSDAYQKLMVRQAEWFPAVNFLVFTKRWQYDWPGESSPNLRVYYSAWPTMPIPYRRTLTEKGFTGVAWIEGDERTPSDAKACQGTCDKCRGCWGGFTDILLKKH